MSHKWAATGHRGVPGFALALAAEFRVVVAIGAGAPRATSERSLTRISLGELLGVALEHTWGAPTFWGCRITQGAAGAEPGDLGQHLVIRWPNVTEGGVAGEPGNQPRPARDIYSRPRRASF